MKLLQTVATALAVVALTGIAFAQPAAAHERRAVGPYTFVVGWLSEPSYIDQLNGLDLTVTETAGAKPVEGLDKTLQAEVIVGGGAKKQTLTLAARFGLPGKYRGELLPTRLGDFSFHIFGTVGTVKVDEKFDSGPGRFGGIEPTTDLQFPDRIASPADLATRIDDLGNLVKIGIAISVLALVASIAIPLTRRPKRT